MLDFQLDSIDNVCLCVCIGKDKSFSSFSFLQKKESSLRNDPTLDSIDCTYRSHHFGLKIQVTF